MTRRYMPPSEKIQNSGVKYILDDPCISNYGMAGQLGICLSVVIVKVGIPNESLHLVRIP